MYNFKITIRRLLKDKAYSLICIVGLIIGIGSFLILFLHVNNEENFDKHFTDHQQIYRVTSTPVGHDATIWARSLGIVHTASSEIPEVELATEFIHCPVGTIKIDDNSLQQKDIFWVDKTFVEMFDVKAKVGSLLDLEEPNTVFISEDFARKHFGKQNPVGQIIKFESGQYTQDIGDYVIRGIVKNTQSQTHFKYELLASQKGNMQKSFEETLPNLKVLWAYNYFKLKNGASAELVAHRLKDFWDNSSLKQEGGPKEYDFSLFPIDDIHLKSDFRFELRESSSKINMGLFIMISLVILLVSLLNFINLTIAKLIKRARELGLKRSIGAAKIQLIGQVLIEVFLVCSLSIFLSFALIESLKPYINQLFEINFDIYYSNPVVYLSMVGILITCLLLTALFVTFFLFGKASTLDILAERNNFSGSAVLKSLLVGQVCIVIILISGTFLVNKQINFISNRSLGFDKGNVVVLHVKDLSKDPKVFAEALRKQSQVKSVGFTSQHFGYPSQSLPLESLGIEGTAELVFANYDYLRTMDIRLVKNWIKPEAESVKGMVINEHLYKRLMEKHGSMDALNAYLAAKPIAPDMVRINVIGVAKDFNYNSAHQAIGDFAFWLGESPRQARFTHIRLNPGNLRSAMSQVEFVWEDYYPGQELEYFFIDDKVAEQYKGEIILSRILSSFSILGILISIIGISALSLFISQQRTKEIGIRKVNGAKVSEVLAMLNKDFVKWVAIAFVIATPIAYYAMNKWLENFAYKTNLSWWIFALAGVLALGIALLTVSFQSWKAATKNPVESLRYE